MESPGYFSANYNHMNYINKRAKDKLDLLALLDHHIPQHL